MTEKLVSVIIPVHNVEEYLEQCLDSVISQTYHNLEIILINDSSTDKSGDICKKYQSKDNRIKYFETDFKSAGKNRNFGIKKSTGAYIVFFDSDDYVEEDMIEKLYLQIEKSNSDAVFCAYTNEYKNSKEIVYQGSESENIFDYAQIKNELIYNSIYVGSYKTKLPLYAVWNGMYKLEIINKNQIEFLDENDIFSEDSVFNFEYLTKCKRVSVINDALYIHRMFNQNSICNIYNERYNKIDDWYNKILDLAKENKLNIANTKKFLQERYVNFTIAKINQSVLLSKETCFVKIKMIKKVCNNLILSDALANIDINSRPAKRKIYFNMIKYKKSIMIYFFVKINHFAKGGKIN